MNNDLCNIDDKNVLTLSDVFIPQVRTFGSLGYSPDRIASLLQISKREKLALSIRISTPGDPYYDAYINGKAIGEYNIDAELAKQAEKGDIEAITTLEQRKDDRKVLDLRNKLFGV